MDTEMKNLVGSLIIFAVGLLSFLLRNKASEIKEDQKKYYYTKEQVRNNRIIIGLSFMAMGLVLLILTCKKILAL